jgi:hypothetical protein
VLRIAAGSNEKMKENTGAKAKTLHAVKLNITKAANDS